MRCSESGMTLMRSSRLKVSGSIRSAVPAQLLLTTRTPRVGDCLAAATAGAARAKAPATSSAARARVILIAGTTTVSPPRNRPAPVGTDAGIDIAMNDTQEEAGELSPAEAAALIEAGAELIDVRRPYEYEGGRIPGARNIDMN